MSGLIWSAAPLESAGDFAVSEERVNQFTHAAAVPATIAGTVLLVQASRVNGDPWLTAGCAVYGVSLIAVYLFSALSHSFLPGRWRDLFRTLDQVSIFALISGSFTPVGITICRDGHWWLVLAAMWMLASAGMYTKLFVTRLENVPVWFYVMIGWLPLLATGRVAAWFPMEGLFWILAGGALYTIGTYFLLNDQRVRYFHAVWHVLVVTASVCHFVAMYCFLIPGLRVSG